MINSLSSTALVDWVCAAKVDPEGAHCTESKALLGPMPIYRDFCEMLDRHANDLLTAPPARAGWEGIYRA